MLADTETRAEAAARPIVAPPLAMLAEVTHRCPLACLYCSNPLELAGAREELSTEQWSDAFAQAAALGVLQLHLSGGEPAARRDLVELTKAAAGVGLYTNLITSGLGLTKERVRALADAGLEHFQLSLQGTTEAMTALVGGRKGAFARKTEVAGWARAAGLPLTINAVCHRLNMDALPDMVDFALALGAGRIEIANVQFYGWGAQNIATLLPTREQSDFANAFVAEARERLKGRLVIDYVPSDYHAKYPKACAGGWGRVGLNIDPTGKVLPCHAAATIPNLTSDTVRDRPLADIWFHGEAFQAYRGDAWMPEPCSRCSRKHIDFGGCRCQAMAYAGDAAATDPVCSLSPYHDRITRWVGVDPANVELVYRAAT